jgi:hypothetical protein
MAVFVPDAAVPGGSCSAGRACRICLREYGKRAGPKKTGENFKRKLF